MKLQKYPKSRSVSIYRAVFIIVLLVLTFFGVNQIFQLNSVSSFDDDSKKLKVLSSTSIINDLVKNIGGDFVVAESLMGPDIDPHIYQATEGDIHRLMEADIIFYNGLYLEAKLTDVFLELSGRKPVYAVSQLIDREKLLIYQSMESVDKNVGANESTKSAQVMYDPHIWFDLSLWQDAARLVRDKLVAALPEKNEAIHLNYLKLVKLMDGLDEIFTRRISAIPPEKRVLISSHDAFSYFGRRYGFRIEGLKGISTAAKVTVNDIRRMTEVIIEHQVRTVFIEATLSPKDIQALVEVVEARGDYRVKIGGTLLTDALGEEGSEGDTFFRMFIYNVKTIVEGIELGMESSKKMRLDFDSQIDKLTEASEKAYEKASEKASKKAFGEVNKPVKLGVGS